MSILVTSILFLKKLLSCTCLHMYTWSVSGARGIGSPGVAGSCEPPDVAAGDMTRVQQQGSKRAPLRSVRSGLYCHSFLVFVWDRISLCSSDCPRTHAGLKLKDQLASASWVLRIKVCASATPPHSFPSFVLFSLFFVVLGIEQEPHWYAAYYQA